MDELELLDLIAEAHAEAKMARFLVFVYGLFTVFFGLLLILK